MNLEPRTVEIPNNCMKIIQVTAGDFHSVALADDDKTMFAWGEGKFGTIGNG